LWACAVLLLAWGGACPGQEPVSEESRDIAKPLSARDPLPELPVNGILDEGNIFGAGESALMAADIEDFRTRVGFSLYLVTANYIFGDSVENYGERLVKEGLKGRAGVIILYERGSGRLHYSASAGALGRVEDMRQIFLTASKAAAFLPDDATKAQRLRAAVQALTTAAAQWKTTGTLPAPTPAGERDPPSPAPESEETLPAPPNDFVSDSADVFETEAGAALKAELVRFHAEHDMDVYVVTNLYLSKRTAQMQAEKLAEKWLSDRYGAVVVLNRGTAPGEHPLGVALSANDERIVAGRTLLQALERARARYDEMQSLPGGTRAEGVHAAVRVLLETLGTRGSAARAAHAQVTSPRQWNVMTGVATALLAGAVLLFIFHRVQERLETRSNEQFRFPDVTVGRRLGAQQGGGNVAGISFGRRQ
jgi:uncharacterized membrane protein YgcG